MKVMAGYIFIVRWLTPRIRPDVLAILPNWILWGIIKDMPDMYCLLTSRFLPDVLVNLPDGISFGIIQNGAGYIKISGVGLTSVNHCVY